MAYFEIIGKSVLGEHGFCQVYEKMGYRYYEQLAKLSFEIILKLTIRKSYISLK